MFKWIKKLFTPKVWTTTGDFRERTTCNTCGRHMRFFFFWDEEEKLDNDLCPHCGNYGMHKTVGRFMTTHERRWWLFFNEREERIWQEGPLQHINITSNVEANK